MPIAVFKKKVTFFFAGFEKKMDFVKIVDQKIFFKNTV